MSDLEREDVMTGAGPARARMAIAAAGLVLGGLALAQSPPETGTDTVWPLTPLPSPCPPEWRGLLGIYGAGDGVLLVLERDGALEAMIKGGRFYALEVLGRDRFRFPNVGRLAARNVVFSRDASGRAVSLQLDEARLPRDPSSEGAVLHFEPIRPIGDVVREARAASPPAADHASSLPSDLVDVTTLDPSIRVESRYAGPDNPVGMPLLEASNAFLQRPAAEALVRVHRGLARHGYGLVVRDAYHPWWVTKTLWDAAPPQVRRFLADPGDGTGYNRGTTVDVGLFRLADGATCELPSLYDERSVRAYVDFPGGTSEQRWLRDLLVEALEAEDYSSLRTQWWRYDWPEGRRFPVLNHAPGQPREASTN